MGNCQRLEGRGKVQYISLGKPFLTVQISNQGGNHTRRKIRLIWLIISENVRLRDSREGEGRASDPDKFTGMSRLHF